jgi:hypothetical protein
MEGDETVAKHCTINLEVENIQSKDYYDNVQTKTILTIGGKYGDKILTIDNGFQTGMRK